MSDPLGSWTEHLKDLTNTRTTDDAEAQFVRDLYVAAQDDLDEQRAEADDQREE